MRSNEQNAPRPLGLAGLDLNKVRTFACVAEHGGVTAAAARLHLTRSAVSHSLTTLEAALGLPLFLRVGRGLVLSEEGRALLGAWRDASERLASVLDELEAGQQTARGTVQLGVYLGFSRFRLARVIEGFCAEHEGATVRLRYDSPSELSERLLAGRLDLSLSLRPARDGSSQLASRKLFEQTLVLVARTRPRGRAGDFGAIAKLAFVDYFRGEPLIGHWLAHHFPGERLPRGAIRVYAASTDLALELALRGVGACVLPEDLARPHQERGDLVVLRGSGRPLRDSVWLNALAGRRGSVAVQRFRDALVAGLG